MCQSVIVSVKNVKPTAGSSCGRETTILTNVESFLGFLKLASKTHFKITSFPDNYSGSCI